MHIDNLSNVELTNLSCITAFVNIRYVNLSENSITDLNPLLCLCHIKTLILKKNRIRDANCLSKLKKLVFLDIRKNLLDEIDSVASLADNVYLKQLYLKSEDRKSESNGLCSGNDYPASVISLFKHLVSLDGMIVRGGRSSLYKLEAKIDEMLERKKRQQISEKTRIISLDRVNIVEHHDTHEYEELMEKKTVEFNGSLEKFNKMSCDIEKNLNTLKAKLALSV
ncbi:leucine rich repeat containing 61 [Cichlidogyrus casuarinus]|uniref:Leucine rich repeat containing 61 n=1 Tax=Cichlidogyrus casuarinus TaxID=1844966 RepID=A0ABD2QDL7_9PLAT